jgi:ATP-binding cassette subfamily C (CFTR/MRP) protein 1
LRERCQRTGAGALVVLNQVGLVSQGFDDVIVLKDGAVVCDGPVADVEQDPHFRAVAEAIPQVDVAASAEAQMAQRTKAMHRSTILISAAAGARATRSAVPVASDEKQGFVSSRVWKTYVLAAGVGPCAAVLLVYFLMYSSLAIRDWWLSVWSDAEDAEDNIGFYAGVFSAISFFNIATTLTLIFLVSFAAERAGRSLHEKAVKSLLRAPVGYFETTPLGAITSRLGADLAMVDGGFSMTLDLLLTFVLMVSTLCVAVVLNLPAMAVIFLVVIFASLKVLYGAGVLRIDAKRVSNSDMAPMLSSVQNAVTGAPIARVLDVTGFFIQRTRDHLELWAKSTDLSNIIAQVTTAWCCTMHLVVLFATYVLIRLAQWQGEGLLALCFSYATIWGQWMQLTVNVTLQTLMMGTSLERLLSYIDGELPQEAEWRTDADPSQWPARGAVTFENVAVRYAADKPLVLRGLTLSVNAEERLAVVGRTGAGKSTILTALFRLVEVHSGTIRFDGVDIATLGVHTLRQAVSMIPQEPIVMDGTVRYNLDPFDQESDEKLEAALAKVGLSIALATAAAGAGTGLSAGQKQLVTLARALLQRSHLVVMDEPTSSVDQQTDRQVQQVVRSELRGRTLICIAHRLETVRDYDRLAVIGDGQLLEVGEPGGLLAAPDSAAAQLFSAHEADGTARPAEAETGSRAREGEL